MSDVILRVENVSKQYRLGSFGTNTIGGDVHRWWTTKIRGKEDPFLKVGDVNDRTSKVKSDFVWALKDINFEVKRGEVLGIIGKNGAGKSTMLKLLSRIMSPSTGTIESWGRMASLLEVGTGFHPELTGRENIFLNGAILGMTKAEIKRKLDEIIDFSGCALYIDTPVKRYSSGMTVRLGFAVAAFLDPEILIVDEVLAVGDAEFQKKAIGKMKEVSQGGGRTVLFVSHNLTSVKRLCNRGIILSNGTLSFDGPITKAIDVYEIGQLERMSKLELDYPSIKNLKMQISKAKLLSSKPSGRISQNEQIVFEFEICVRQNVEGAYITVDLMDRNEEILYWTADFSSERFIQKIEGKIKINCTLPNSFFNPGIYFVSFAIYSPKYGVVHHEPNNKIAFEIEKDKGGFLWENQIENPGKIGLPGNWSVLDVKPI